MTTVVTPGLRAESSLGRINYVHASTPSSLYRNGTMLTRRNADGTDGGIEGVVFDEREMKVYNARLLSGQERRVVDKNGFELLPRRLQRSDLDFFDHRHVIEDYYRECEQIVREVAGAPAVVAFDHNVRSATGKKSQQRIRGGQEVQGPANIAHGDYTLRSAPERLQRLAEPPGRNDTRRSMIEHGQSLLDPKRVERVIDAGGRFAIINVWRSIADEPVATHPLALCDAQSVSAEDLSVFEIHYEDRVGENYFSKHAWRHQWFYYPGMTRDEVLLIKQWDSAGPLARSKGHQSDNDDVQAPCTFSFHSAFQDPFTLPDAPERLSVEVRCVVMFE